MVILGILILVAGAVLLVVSVVKGSGRGAPDAAVTQAGPGALWNRAQQPENQWSQAQNHAPQGYAPQGYAPQNQASQHQAPPNYAQPNYAPQHQAPQWPQQPPVR